jgi:exosortase
LVAQILRDAREWWENQPNKAVFFTLLAAWAGLFHFLGNSTFGYIDSPSLFGWLQYVYGVSEDDAHGKLIPLVVLGLLWWKRRELISLPKSPWWPAIALVIIGLLLHILGFVMQQARVSVIAFFVGLYGLMGVLWGRRWLQAVFFPYFLFIFCLPIGTIADTLTLPLRLVVTQISVFIGHSLGIEVIRSGTQIVGANGFNFDVAPACSGIRSLTALTALMTIFGFTTFKTNWKRALMVFLAVPVAVAGNVARITGVIITAETFGDKAGMTFHDSAGFVTFVVAIGCMLAVGHWLREDPPDSSNRGPLQVQPA